MQKKTRLFIESISALSPIVEKASDELAQGTGETAVLRNAQDRVRIASEIARQISDSDSVDGDFLRICAKIAADVGDQAKRVGIMREVLAEVAKEPFDAPKDLRTERQALLEALSSIFSFYVGTFDFFREVGNDLLIWGKSIKSVSEECLSTLSMQKSKDDQEASLAAMIEAGGRILLAQLNEEGRSFIEKAKGKSENEIAKLSKDELGDSWIGKVSEDFRKNMLMMANAVGIIVPRGRRQAN